MFFKKILSFIGFSFLYSLNSYACSSCGSSATSPLVLYPGEHLKMYFGLSENYNYKNYGVRKGSDQKPWYDLNLITKQTATLALGYRTSENSFVTLSGSVVHNEGVDMNSVDGYPSPKEAYLLGDPIISGRYTLINMEISRPFLPQIQMIGSYKHSIAKNMLDGDGDHVDTTGNGYNQLSGGIDFWWGMPFIQFGGSQFVIDSLPRYQNSNGVSKRTRDLQYTTILTVGHTFSNQNFMLQSGIVLDYIGSDHIYYNNNSEVTDPEQQSNSLFVTLNWNVTHLDMIRFSYSYGGAYNGDLGIYTNKTQTTSTMALVAYERIFY